MVQGCSEDGCLEVSQFPTSTRPVQSSAVQCVSTLDCAQCSLCSSALLEQAVLADESLHDGGVLRHRCVECESFARTPRVPLRALLQLHLPRRRFTPHTTPHTHRHIDSGTLASLYKSSLFARSCPSLLLFRYLINDTMYCTIVKVLGTKLNISSRIDPVTITKALKRVGSTGKEFNRFFLN